MSGHYDPDLELALLAACMRSKTARQAARRIIMRDDLHDPAHERVWDMMMTLDRQGHAVDPLTLGRMVTGSGAQQQRLHQVLLDAAAHQMAQPDSVPDYAAGVRGDAIRRRIDAAGRSLIQGATDREQTPEQIAASAVTMLTGLRDHGTDVTALTLRELMEGEDDEPTWVIPGLLETGDRLILTGSEGAGKSSLSRQLSYMAAVGVHPFTESVMPPIKALIVECENKAQQVRRQSRPLLGWLRAQGTADPRDRVMIDCTGRIDITRDRDLSRIHQTIDAHQPDLVILGPLYKMAPRAVQTDDEAAPFLAAVDTITERGPAIIMEAHAGHSSEGQGKNAKRSLRPRGSSALMGWPEFGLGIRMLNPVVADLEPWRGHREARAWPHRIRRAAGNRWIETRPDDVDGEQEPPREAPWPPEDEEQQGSLV